MRKIGSQYERGAGTHDSGSTRLKETGISSRSNSDCDNSRLQQTIARVDCSSVPVGDCALICSPTNPTLHHHQGQASTAGEILHRDSAVPH